MEYVAGILTALCIAIFSRMLKLDNRRSFYSTVLIVIAIFYVLFAIIGGEVKWIVAETIVALLFAGLAIISRNMPMLVVGVGLIAHGLYDAQHDQLLETRGVPQWWPAYCATVDILLGIWVLYLGRLQR